MRDDKLYKELYLHLFNAVTDGLAALEKGWSESARSLLIQAQQDCEERYIEDADEE